MPDPSSVNDAVPVPGAAVEEAHRGASEFRQQIGHISRQSSIFFAGTLFSAAAAYLFKVYLARVLGAEVLGIYALGMTIVGFLSVFNALGLPSAAIRFVAAYSATQKRELLGGFLARSVLLLLISNLLFGAVLLLTGRWIAVHFYHAPALARYMGWFALIMVFGTMNLFFGQVLAGYKDVARRTFITNFIGTPATILLTVILVSLGLGLRGYLSAQVWAAVLTFALLTLAAWKLTPRQARVPAAWRVGFQEEVVSFSIASFGLVLVEFLISQADKILIGFFTHPRQVGIYAVAMGLVAFVPSVLQAVNQIFGPTIAELHARREQALLQRLFQTLTKWVLGITFPLIMMLVIFARPVMRIFGGDFETGWPVLVIGTLGELVDCGVGSVGFLLMMSGNERRLLRIQIFTGAGTVALSLALIPRWGITGAAIASAATNVITNLWCLNDVRRALGLFPYSRSFYRLFAPLLASLTVLWLAHSAFRAFRPALVIAVSLIAAYAAFAVIALLWGLDRDDRLIVGAIWGRLRAAFPKSKVSPP